MCHVLIIEDDWFIGEHIESIARESGASSIDRAETEQDAIAAALANPPAVILSDVNLAEGTGPKAVWAIRAQIGHCPVIFITGTPEACEPCDYAHAILEKPLARIRLCKHSVKWRQTERDRQILSDRGSKLASSDRRALPALRSGFGKSGRCVRDHTAR